MVIQKALSFNNKIVPMQIVKPVLAPNGNVIRDTCVTNCGEFYKWSSVQNNDFLCDAELSDVKIHIDKNGRIYGRLDPLNSNGIYNRYNHLARVILYAFDDGKYPIEHYKNLQADHINPSVPVSNRLDNLQWVDRSKNMYNAGATGVMIKKYSKSTVHKLCEKLCEKDYDRQAIANELGISADLIDDVKSGRSHKSVSSQYLDKGFEYRHKPRRPREERLKEAHDICRLLSEGKRNREISRELNVPSGLVTSVSKGISYRDIGEQYGLYS